MYFFSLENHVSFPTVHLLEVLSVIEQVLQTQLNWLYRCVEEMLTFLKKIGVNDYKIPDTDKIVFLNPIHS